MGLRPSVKREGSGGGALLQAAAEPSLDGNDATGDGAPSSSSTASSPPAPPQREAWTVRGQLLLNFHDAISRAINSPEMVRKCGRIAEDMSRAEGSAQEAAQNTSHDATIASSTTGVKSHSMAEEYGAEAAMIVENKTKRDAHVRNKAVALGAFSFVALRSTRGLSSIVRKSIAQRKAASNSYQFEGHLKPDVRQSAVEVNQPSRLRRAFRVALDATIATSITLFSGAFLFMPKPSAYIEDMSKLPLVEGKSVYAEMVCPPLLREYRRVLEQYGGTWPVRGNASNAEEGQRNDERERKLTQEDVSLNVIRTFVENCSKRCKYEQALLEERHALSVDNASAVSRLMRRITRGDKTGKRDGAQTGTDENEEGKLGTVSVPRGGVPDWVAVDLDLDVFSLVGDEEGETEDRDGEEDAGI